MGGRGILHACKRTVRDAVVACKPHSSGVTDVKWLMMSMAALAFAGPALADTDGYVPTFDTQRLAATVQSLSSDAFEGRGPATPGETKTIDYIAKQMQAAGLAPGGDLENGKRGWTQAVPLARFQITGTPEIELVVAGKSQKLTQGTEIALRAAQDGSRRVDITHAPLVFVGYGVTAPERHWDDFKGVDLKGKIAVALVNDPDYATGKGDFGGKAMTYYGRWTYKYEEAARRGALGLLIVHETKPASYGWPTVKNSNTNAQFDIVRDDPAAAHPRLEGWIQRDLAVSLFKRAGLDFEAQKKLAQTRAFKPVTLKGETFSAHYAVAVDQITSHNVVGKVTGSTYPDETIIYSAHWDHLGVGAPDATGDRIYNGAVDNATGIAALLEMGRAFAHAPRPQRSVVFLAVTAEEKGLLGSEYYASHPLYPLATTVADINTDALSPQGAARDFSISGSARLGLLDDLIAVAKRHDLKFTPDSHPEAGYFFRSDHFSFAKRGVPALSFGSGEDLVEGGKAAGEAQARAYTRKHYHQPSDEFQSGWTFAGMAHDLPVLYDLGIQLADSRAWPNWAQDSEFRAARDRTAAERR
jgi:Zn-dependent M28 family amino/carboxypeptidase